MKLRYIAAAVGLALLLAGCQTSVVSGPNSNPLVVQSKIDAQVANASQSLKAACIAIGIGIDLSQMWAKNPRVLAALDKAEVVVGSYCSGPTPGDIPGALRAIAVAYAAVQAAKPAG